ncbi:DUF3572 domain-containing protein [Aestuariibius sp. HNIBRBA575]|uniref:DUF3572 domain-containing protein n=1 Tax=Aestuariibius sp. HNIBRBA575 TaxID=3233343 RepID=UPI0034A1133F
MNGSRAEEIAIMALAWVAQNEELCPVFLGSTGAAADEIRTMAGDPAFLGSVLEFLTMDDAWIVAFCDQHNLDYDQPLRARYALPGAQQIHWT